MDEVEQFGSRQVVERVVADLKAKFPRRPYTTTSTLSEIMMVEGNQQVVNYLKKRYSIK